MFSDPVIHPRIVVWSHSEPSDAMIMASLSAVPRHCIVRITGGCAEMDSDDSNGVLELFAGAFEGFDGAMLIGGTRMILENDPEQVLFGITEIGPHIRTRNPDSYVLGIIPRLSHLTFSTDCNVLEVCHEAGLNDAPDFTTIVHPSQDTIVGIKGRVTKQEIWDDEVEFSRYMTQHLRQYGGWNSLLVAYNGGGVTEREVRATAERGWPVLLVNGSGRKSEELANDQGFLRDHPSVVVCERDVASMRAALEQLSVVEPRRIKDHLRVVEAS